MAEEAELRTLGSRQHPGAGNPSLSVLNGEAAETRDAPFLFPSHPSTDCLCLFRPQALANPIPAFPRGLAAEEGLDSAVGPSVSLWSPSLAQFLHSALGLAALGLALRTVLFTAGPALLLLLLLVSFLAFDLLHGTEAPTLQHRVPSGGQSQGAGEGPGQQRALLLLPVTTTRQVSLQDALLLLLSSLGLLLRIHGLPLALLGLAFCLHPWV
ncbi:uncharacterized protein C20orf141 homolog [Rhynchocyon petersi]